MNVVEKYGGTSVGTIAQIKAVAAHAAKLKAQGIRWSLWQVPWERQPTS